MGPPGPTSQVERLLSCSLSYATPTPTNSFSLKPRSGQIFKACQNFVSSDAAPHDVRLPGRSCCVLPRSLLAHQQPGQFVDSRRAWNAHDAKPFANGTLPLEVFDKLSDGRKEEFLRTSDQTIAMRCLARARTPFVVGKRTNEWERRGEIGPTRQYLDAVPTPHSYFM